MPFANSCWEPLSCSLWFSSFSRLRWGHHILGKLLMEAWPLWDKLGPQNIPMYDTYQKRDLGQAQEGEAAPHRFTFHSPGGKSVPQRWSDFGHHCRSLCLSPRGLFEWLFCQWRWKPNLIPNCGHTSAIPGPLMLAVFPLRIFLLAPFPWSNRNTPVQVHSGKHQFRACRRCVPWVSLPLSTPVCSELLLRHPSLCTP